MADIVNIVFVINAHALKYNYKMSWVFFTFGLYTVHIRLLGIKVLFWRWSAHRFEDTHVITDQCMSKRLMTDTPYMLKWHRCTMV